MRFADQESIGAEHAAWMLDDFGNIRLRHTEVHHRSLQIFLQQQIEHDFLRRNFPLFGNRSQRLAFANLVWAVGDAGYDYAVPAGGGRDVFPARQTLPHFCRQTLAHRRVAQALQQFFRSTGMRMRRHQNAQHRAAGRIRILVEGGVQPLVNCHIKQLQHPARRTPVFLANHFQVGNMGDHAGFSRQVKDFADRFDNQTALVAHMHDENSFVAGADRGQCDQFVRRGKNTGRINQSCRKAERPLIVTLLQ